MFSSFTLSWVDKITTEALSFVSVILNSRFWFAAVPGTRTQSLDNFNWILISELSKGISIVLQKLLRYVNGTIISTSFVPPFPVCPINNTNKKVIFKNCAPFTNCITEIINIQVDEGQDIDIVIPMYNLIEHTDAYSKTSRGLWQYYRREPALDNKNNIINFPADKNNSTSFKFKQQITW